MTNEKKPRRKLTPVERVRDKDTTKSLYAILKGMFIPTDITEKNDTLFYVTGDNCNLLRVNDNQDGSCAISICQSQDVEEWICELRIESILQIRTQYRPWSRTDVVSFLVGEVAVNFYCHTRGRIGK